MQIFENLPPIVGLILGFVLLVWVVFVFLVPFMIEGIRRSSRETRDELADLNHKLDELIRYLRDAGRAPEAPPARDAGRTADSPRGRDSARAAQSGRPGSSTQPTAPSTKAAGKAEAGRAEARRRREPTISETDFENEPRPSRREPRVK